MYCVLMDNSTDIGMYVIKKENQTFTVDDVLKEKLLKKLGLLILLLTCTFT